MNISELQRLKIEWIAAKESGNREAEVNLLKNHPEEQSELIDFIAAYYATAGNEQAEELLPLTQRACQTALGRVFSSQVAAANLAELRKSRASSKLAVARGLRLTVDVWDKFESGAIELVSLSQRQVERLAAFFQVNSEQFSTLLSNSQTSFTLNRRQTRAASRKEQGSQQQSFAEAVARSTMSKEDKRFWLEQ